MKYLLSLLAIITILAVTIPSSVFAYDVASQYPIMGTSTTSVAGAISKVIEMHGMTKLSLILTATGGNFNSTNLVIEVSEDGATYVVVDTIALSTGTTKGAVYGAGLKSSTIAIDPALFPYIRVTTSAGVGSVTEKLYYVAGS